MAVREGVPVTAFVALGSNLNQPAQQIRLALSALAALPDTTVVCSSSLYANPPIGPQDQPEFVNAVTQLRTMLSAPELLAALKALERAAGRQGSRHWGERVLDLDLLSYADQVSEDPVLTLPHPGIAFRRFVLVPWLEIAPDACLPDGRALADLLPDAPSHSLHKL